MLDRNSPSLVTLKCFFYIYSREYAAVSEFIQSDMDFHIMRDHPQHDIQILGGTWGIKLVKPEIRQKMSLSIRKMFGKDEFYASREHSGPDQKILKRIVW